MKFSIKYFFSKFDQIRRKPVDLVTFTEEIFNKKLHFLCSGGYLGEKICIIEVWQDAKYNPCAYYHTSHWVEHVIWTSHIRLINALFLEGNIERIHCRMQITISKVPILGFVNNKSFPLTCICCNFVYKSF